MTPDLARIIESKRAYRRQLAALPVGEKLRLLDALRARMLAVNPEAIRRRFAGRATGPVAGEDALP